MHNALSQFREAIQSAGLIPPDAGEVAAPGAPMNNAPTAMNRCALGSKPKSGESRSAGHGLGRRD